MINIELPYDFGTFVKVLDDKKTVKYYGTISAYTVTEDGWLAWVSIYKQALSEECLPEEIKLMTEKEIKNLIKGEKNII